MNYLAPSEWADVYSEYIMRTLFKPINSPQDIKDALDRHVIGQHHAKEQISSAMYYRDLLLRNNETSVSKYNILLLGHSGSGKTHLIRTLAHICNRPLYNISADKYTPNGYVGTNINKIAKDLVENAKSFVRSSELNLEKAAHVFKDVVESTIIFVDEVDKLAIMNGDMSWARQRQSMWLRIIEGEVLTHDSCDYDTSKMQFIFAGAFSGLQDLHKADSKQGIGFMKQAVEKKPKNQLDTGKLIEYGLMREFIGRFDVMIEMDSLSKNDFKRILRDIDNSLLKQVCKTLKLLGYNAKFSNGFINSIVNEAWETKIGARGLKRILYNRLNKFLFLLPSLALPSNLIITNKLLERYSK